MMDQRMSRIGSGSWLTLFAILVLPVFAMTRQMHMVDWRILFGIPLFISGVAFLAYRMDKRRAREGLWRIPESTLHTKE